jgi:hypothetical protein
MAQFNILIGCESFKEIRENYVYVDKTSIIEEMLTGPRSKVSLITRPRRFGKTLTMSMLHAFFDITCNSRQLFEGLAISKNTALCEKWMNKHPTVFITFKEIEGDDFDDAYEQLTERIRVVLIDHSYLLQSNKINPGDREKLTLLSKSAGTRTDLANSLSTLCRALKSHWGKPVILLVDEYDVPINYAQQEGYYAKMIRFMRRLLSGSLKSNTSLEFAVVTGCLRIARESIFTGLNNFKCFGISHTKYADKFGFTQQEVDNLLDEAALSDKKDLIQEWYDGYRFGKGTEIYCPWDVLNYVSDLQIEPSSSPLAYWNNTSGNAIVRTLIDQAEETTRDKIGDLISGLPIQEKLTEDLTYDTVYKDESNLWSMLYLTGYLTKAPVQPGGEYTAFVIPNKEIRTIFKDTVWQWFKGGLNKNALSPLVSALWGEDSETVQNMFTDILFNTISYYDSTENFYHGFIAGVLTGAGMGVKSNRESGLGRTDVTVLDPANKRAIIIEFKSAETSDDLELKADEALVQIEERKYAAEIDKRYKIIKYGMSFYKKECFAKLG